MDATLAVYAGSFDPPTRGHLDIIGRAATIFGRVVVGLGENPAKTYLLPREVRLDLLREICAALPNVTVSAYDGLLVDFCRSIGAGVIVRGLRAVTDFEFEFQVGLANRDLAPGVETVFLLPEPRFIFISSSIVREIFQMGGDVEPYVPPASLRAMKTWATPRFPRPRP